MEFPLLLHSCCGYFYTVPLAPPHITKMHWYSSTTISCSGGGGCRADKQLRTNYNRNDSVPCIEYTASLFLTNRAHSDNRALSPSSRALSVCQSEAGIARPVTAIAQFPFNFLPLRIGLFNSCCCFSWTAYREIAVSKVFGGNLL